MPGAQHSPSRTQDGEGVLSEQTARGDVRPPLPRFQSNHYLLKHLEKGLGGVYVLTLLLVWIPQTECASADHSWGTGTRP